MTTIVVAAAVIEHDDRFLVTRRQAGVHLEGHWEFPGGKCHAGESLVACLARELHEELNVGAEVGVEILSTTHDYPDRRVELHFLRCVITGQPAPQQGQEMRWVTREELRTLQFPPADAELIELLVSSRQRGLRRERRNTEDRRNGGTTKTTDQARLAIVGYPTLDEFDLRWIAEVRRARDPQALRIGPHFTLVFQFQAMASEIAKELLAVAALAKRVPFTIRRAEAVRDVMAGVGGHVFLIPDEGGAEITELHDRLYGGALRPHRGADIPFVPHITVGADSDFERCQILADALNQDQRIVRGVLDTIALVNVATTPVQAVKAVSLGP